jgi:uncharacterized integral membrane protein
MVKLRDNQHNEKGDGVGHILNGLRFLLGLVLLLIGATVTYVAAKEFIQGSSEYPLVVDIITFVLVGVLPIGGGIWLCRAPFRKDAPTEVENQEE